MGSEKREGGILKVVGSRRNGENYTILCNILHWKQRKEARANKKGGNQGRVSQKSQKHFSLKKPFGKI